MRNRTYLRGALLALFVAFLAGPQVACGGRGGGGNNTPETPFPVQKSETQPDPDSGQESETMWIPNYVHADRIDPDKNSGKKLETLGLSFVDDDQDQDPDLVALTADGPKSTVQVFQNEGGDKFVEKTNWAEKTATDEENSPIMLVAYFDLTPSPDLLFIQGKSWQVHLNPGTPDSFPYLHEDDVSHHTAHAVDMNQDGFPDLVLTSMYETRIHLNNGKGEFPYKPEKIPHMEATCSAIGDIDGDLIPDLVIGSPYSPESAVFLGGKGKDGLPLFDAEPHQIFSSDTNLFKLADIDNDLDLDLVEEDGVRFNNDGIFGDLISLENKVEKKDSFGKAFKMYTSSNAIVSIEVVDTNQDGKIDIFYFRETKMTLWLNTGNGVFEKCAHQPVPPNSKISSTVMADWDDDGDLDLVLGTANGIDFFRNDQVKEEDLFPSKQEPGLAEVLQNMGSEFDSFLDQVTEPFEKGNTGAK